MHMLERKNITRGVKVCFTYDRFSRDIIDDVDDGDYDDDCDEEKEVTVGFYINEFVELCRFFQRGDSVTIFLLH